MAHAITEGVTLSGFKTGYGLDSGESHDGVGAEGAKAKAQISQAKGQNQDTKTELISVCLVLLLFE